MLRDSERMEIYNTLYHIFDFRSAFFFEEKGQHFGELPHQDRQVLILGVWYNLEIAVLSPLSAPLGGL